MVMVNPAGDVHGMQAMGPPLEKWVANQGTKFSVDGVTAVPVHSLPGGGVELRMVATKALSEDERRDRFDTIMRGSHKGMSLQALDAMYRAQPELATQRDLFARTGQPMTVNCY